MKRALIVAASCLAAFPALAAADTKTIVTIDGYDPTGQEWTGEVRSSKARCERDRKVILFEKLVGQPDRRVGTTYSDRAAPGDYVWAVSDPVPPMADTSYYAKAPRKGNCRGDRSPVFTI